MTHHSDCIAQNANTLFGDPGPCTCPKGWPRKSKAHTNPCYGAALTKVEAPATHYRVSLPFTPSTTQLAAYASHHGHTIPQKRTVDAETGEVDSRDTFDDDALRSLRVKYPKDPLYPLIEGYRVLDKARGTYIGAFGPTGDLMGTDGRLHDIFRHTPKTLRLAMALLQLLPRPISAKDLAEMADDDPRRVYDGIRRCIRPAPGHTFVAADFSGIEPLLVAYLAARDIDRTDVSYLRACRLNSHSWITSTLIGHPVDIMGSASDEDILGQLSDLAKGGPYTVRGKLLSWKQVRTGCKTTHMASLYAGGPGEIARANPDLFEATRDARYFQDHFFELVSLVPRWHTHQAETCERDGYLVAPSGFRLHGYNLFNYRWKPKERVWVRSMNREAKEMIAAVPQHLGMLYLATAVRAFVAEQPEMAAWLRLLIHDEVFAEVPTPEVAAFTAALVEVMQRPHPLMPLWPEASAVMQGDSHLRVAVESKASEDSWGAMA